MFQLQVGKSLPCSHSRSVGGDFSAWGLAGLQEAWYRFPSSLWSGFWASIVICTFKDNRIFLGKYFVYVYQPWHRRPKVDLPRDYELPYNTKMSCQIDCFPTFLLLSFFIERRWWAEGGWDADIDQATPWTFLSIWKKNMKAEKAEIHQAATGMDSLPKDERKACWWSWIERIIDSRQWQCSWLHLLSHFLGNFVKQTSSKLSVLEGARWWSVWIRFGSISSFGGLFYT